LASPEKTGFFEYLFFGLLPSLSMRATVLYFSLAVAEWIPPTIWIPAAADDLVLDGHKAFLK